MRGPRAIAAACFMAFTAVPAISFAMEHHPVSIQDDYYIIGPGDVLALELFDAVDLSGQLTVLNDGTIPLPLVGSVSVSGLTLQQATTRVEHLMSAELLRPDLQLQVVSPRPIRVALVGQVERPGIYSLTSNEIGLTQGGPAARLNGLPTVVDAIQKAGGITQQANLRKIVLQRRLPGSQSELSYKQARLDLLNLVMDGDQSQNPFLFDGDTIRITKSEEVPEEIMELAAVNLSPKLINVNVIGEVQKPGRVQLASNTPLIQAILAAGGPKNWRASTGNVELVRINRNGSATLRKFRIDLRAGASSRSNPPLRNGDSVRVNRTPLARTNDAINAVSQPLSGLVQMWTLFRLINTN